MFIFSLLTVLLLDQITKLWMHLQGRAVINTGVSFAWFQDVPPQSLLMVTVLLSLGLGIYFRSTWKQYPLASGIFWGGVLSNIVDRLLLGGVTDWLTIPTTHLKNNLADVAIGIGLLGLVIQTIRGNDV